MALKSTAETLPREISSMPEKLTEALLKGLHPPERGERFIYDSELTGFAIKIFAPTRRNPGGARTFVLAYRHDGAELGTASAPGRSGRSPVCEHAGLTRRPHL